MSRLGQKPLQAMVRRRKPVTFASGGGAHSLGPCAFEQYALKLGIPSEVWEFDGRLRSWAERNAKRRYVPEYLLRAWGLTIDVRLCG